MEALIAASIFTFVASIAITVFINVSKTEKTAELTNSMYEDARVIMEMLSKQIRGGTIDYEEYYSLNVLNAANYGANRGVYASRFYDPGFTINNDTGTIEKGINPDNLGIECIGPDGKYLDCGSGGEVFTLSVDQNTGSNLDDSAFCKEAGCGNDPLKQTELHIISTDGKSKTIIGRLKVSGKADDYVLVMAEMEGSDSDGNGVVDKFDLKKEYMIDDADKSLEKFSSQDPWTPTLSKFVPLSPLRSSVKDLKFKIWPNEDPYRAFAEPGVQYQPSVTIIMTIVPSESERASFSGTIPEVTVQSTVTTGTHTEIQTYPPTRDLSWIK